MDVETLIIGAGLAGLRLADRLQATGRNFLLIEARDLPGGRIRSLAAAGGNQSQDRYDLGPAWFWPGQPLMAGLANELRLRVFSQYADGRLVLQEADGRIQTHDYAAMAGSLRIDGGMAALTDGLAARLPPDNVYLGHRLERLERTGGGLRAHLLHRDGALIVTAGQVVMALPPRLVARLTLEPALDTAQRDALAAIPTWMAGHAKLVAVYEAPFWRAAGLSGDGMSRRGPLVEIHDASPMSGRQGALFGFLGLPAIHRAGRGQEIAEAAIAQLAAMFGAAAARPLDVLFQDWATDDLTATSDDQSGPAQHPDYGLPPVLRELWNGALILASTEVAAAHGGFLEGALEAAETGLASLSQRANASV
jgi:monoamine oxidase